MNNDNPDPSHILQTATAFWASKALLTAVELDLYSALAEGALTADAIAGRLSLEPRPARDFLDALLALGFIDRQGEGEQAIYANTPATAAFLTRKNPQYIGGFLEMLNSRLYGFWQHLGDALRTGQPQNELRDGGRSMFEALYADEARLGEFLAAMSGVQAASFARLAEAFDFSRFATVCDVGGALGALSCALARRHPRLALTTFDLPPVAPHAERYIATQGLSDRITVVSGDFFSDPLPAVDVITMGNILHDWNLERKKQLIASAYAALPAGGALVVIENIIDDARRENAFGLLMSLNMLIEFGDAFDYTGAEFRDWCEEAGFRSFEFIPLAGPTSAAVAWR